jgi:hypothetical protein
MKHIRLYKDFITEEVQSGVVHCSGKSCNWSWNLADGLDGGETNPYLCHKCWHDNTPAITESADPFWTQYVRLVDLGMIDLEDWSKIKDDVVLLVKERLASHYPNLDVEKLAFDEIRIHQQGKGGRDPYYSVYIDKGVNYSYKVWNCRLVIRFQKAAGRLDSSQLITVPDYFWERPIGGYQWIPSTVAQSRWIADEIIKWMDKVFVPFIGVEIEETN